MLAVQGNFKSSKNSKRLGKYKYTFILTCSLQRSVLSCNSRAIALWSQFQFVTGPNQVLFQKGHQGMFQMNKSARSLRDAQTYSQGKDDEDMPEDICNSQNPGWKVVWDAWLPCCITLKNDKICPAWQSQAVIKTLYSERETSNLAFWISG